jgi:hypothetical protein
MNADRNRAAIEQPRLSALFYTLGFAIIALLMFAVWEAAAQTNHPPGQQPIFRSDIDPRLKAPIGHRQPRQQDLPPNLRRDEGRTTDDERSLDERLKICREC